MMMGKIIRVFPRRTKATPDDGLVFVNEGPGIVARSIDADEVHISVAFSWDLSRAKQLAKLWEDVAPVKIGGPATGQRSEEFTPGKYLKHGCTITSRGCPNKCWFCTVWRREGVGVRELEIHDGFDVFDDNLLACSEQHIRAVFKMLREQKKPVKFTGGLEAARLKDWHIDEMVNLDLSAIVFAYDTSDDLEPLQEAGKKLVKAGLIRRGKITARSYVLVGFPKDTFGKAERRINECMEAGFFPYVMVFRGKDGNFPKSWRVFRRRWQIGILSIKASIYEDKLGLLLSKTRSKTNASA